MSNTRDKRNPNAIQGIEFHIVNVPYADYRKVVRRRHTPAARSGYLDAAGENDSYANCGGQVIDSFDKPMNVPVTSPPEDEWSISHGTDNGKPMLVRVNSSAKQRLGNLRLPHRLGIAVPLREPDENGFPTPKESEQLGEIETGLFAAVGAAGRVVLIITTGGMREFVSYVSSPEEGKRIVATVRAATPTHKIQFYIQPDADWSAYGQFA